MNEDSSVVLRNLSTPEGEGRTSRLVSFSDGWAELDLEDLGDQILNGTPVGLETEQSLHLGLVDSSETRGNLRRLRIRVEHSLAQSHIRSIQELWSQDQPE